MTDLFPPGSVLAADEVAACDLEGDGDLSQAIVAPRVDLNRARLTGRIAVQPIH